MGTFLSMTSVVGRTKAEVTRSLENYAKSVGGGLEKKTLPADHDNCCIIAEANGNTTISYSHAYTEWDPSSQYISGELNAPVFSFHIHDGDLWMYILFANGEIVDQFNPVPDYWDEETKGWTGNAGTVAKYVPNIYPSDIEGYLVRWDLDDDSPGKAYEDDEFVREDWQLLDFMRKLRLPNPLHDDGTPNGESFMLWTNELSL